MDQIKFDTTLIFNRFGGFIDNLELSLSIILRIDGLVGIQINTLAIVSLFPLSGVRLWRCIWWCFWVNDSDVILPMYVNYSLINNGDHLREMRLIIRLMVVRNEVLVDYRLFNLILNLWTRLSLPRPLSYKIDSGRGCLRISLFSLHLFYFFNINYNMFFLSVYSIINFVQWIIIR